MAGKKKGLTRSPQKANIFATFSPRVQGIRKLNVASDIIRCLLSKGS
jgi:hypothetical protein